MNEAYEAYEAYADMLYRVAYSLLQSREDAEDTVLGVFEKYLKHKPIFREKEHEKAWFIRVTVNQCHDLQRRNKIRSYTPLDEMTEIPSKAKKAEGILEQVLALPKKYKEVILLHYFEDLSVEDTAKSLKISRSAVKMRLVRGRELLKGELDND